MTDTQTNRQTQTDKQTNRQTHTDRQTHRQTQARGRWVMYIKLGVEKVGRGKGR